MESRITGAEKESGVGYNARKTHDTDQESDRERAILPKITQTICTCKTS
jgi:hypothetical protein